MTVYVASNHDLYRQVRYRFNLEPRRWEFDDGVGPWAPSAVLDGKDEAEGVRLLCHDMSYVPVEGP